MKQLSTITSQMIPTSDNHTWTCPHCHEPVEPIRHELGESVFDDTIKPKVNFIRRQYCTCAGGQAQQRNDIEARRKSNWLAAVKDMHRHAMIEHEENASFRFGTWKRKNGNGLHLDKVLQYVNRFPRLENNWLYLHGAVGVGKTHLAVAALRQISAEQSAWNDDGELEIYTACIIEWAELCQLTQESWSNAKLKANIGQTWERARNARIVLIDDLDKTATSEWAMQRLYATINHRYKKKLATIITANAALSNLSSEWRGNTGNAIIDRIAGQVHKTIRMDGESYRMR